MSTTDIIVVKDGVMTGPVRRPVNAAAQAKGSIHEDATASKLGFRGGTVAGSIHMDQFPPLLVEAFGQRWFERGSLSLYFENATMGGEPVRAFAAQPPAGAKGAQDVQVDVWMERDPDGLRVAGGTASAGDPEETSELRRRDIRLSDPSELRMFSSLRPGGQLEAHDATLGGDEQRARVERGQLTEPLDWYTSGSPWGGPIPSPSTVVGFLFRNASRELGRHSGGAVGLFGAIEVRFVNGPLLLDTTYRLSGEVVGAGQSPKTEYVLFDTAADDSDGKRVAEMRMLLRWMKASSSLYKES